MVMDNSGEEALSEDGTTNVVVKYYRDTQLPVASLGPRCQTEWRGPISVPVAEAYTGKCDGLNPIPSNSSIIHITMPWHPTVGPLTALETPITHSDA